MMTKILCAAVVLTACWAIQVHGEDDVENAWKSFQLHHPIAFKSPAEKNRRKANFISTHRLIQQHNEDPSSTFEMEHNDFSVLSADEKKKLLNPVSIHSVKDFREISSEEVISDRQSIANSTDYRTHKCMNAVKNQGQCGSCWAFSSTAVVEFGSCIATGKKVTLSEQQLVDCSTENGGCDGGLEDEAFKYLGSVGGQVTSASYPYTGTDGKCKVTASTPKAAVVSKTNPSTVVKAKDTKTIMALLSQQKLVSVGIAVVNSFFNYKSGVYSERNCKTGILGYHAITAVGYGTLNRIDYWIIRNSWGSNWGANGYILFKRGVDMCEVEDTAVTTTVTA